MVLILGVLAVVLAVSGWLSHRGVPRYGVRMSGSLPLTQKVGTAVIAWATIRNTGAAIPDLDVDVGGCTDHWALDRVSSEGGSLQPAAGSYCDLGPLATGDGTTVELQIVPEDAGSHVCEVTAWVGPLSSRVPQGDELGRVNAHVAIKP
jgi:hypothetical protein